MNTGTMSCTVYADALCIVTLSVCCVTSTGNDTVTDIDIDTDTDTYTDTVDNATEAARKLYFVNHVSYNGMHSAYEAGFRWMPLRRMLITRMHRAPARRDRFK